MILGIRTDKPEAELYLYKDQVLIDSLMWQAHRELSGTLLSKIDKLLSSNAVQKNDLAGIIAYQGPGSFTGLRIGLSVANTLAYSLNIVVVAVSGENWQKKALAELRQQQDYNRPATPLYGSEAHITQPRK